MKIRNKDINIAERCILCVIVALFCSSIVMAGDEQKPYQGYTGTVHQFGFVGGIYNTSNPNYSADNPIEVFHDFGLGATYIMHDYVTRQFAFDFLTSISVVTAKSQCVNGEEKQKVIWPVDFRFSLGPSEDFQAYVGTGIQWNMVEKTVGEYDIHSGKVPSKSINQLSGNTTVGLNFFGPQNYMFHLNIGLKFHYPITDNDNSNGGDGLVDLTKDHSCIILNGGITIDLDKKKNACLMLNYEYPLDSSVSRYANSNGNFWKKTQSISLGVMFYIGGTRK